MRTFQAAMLAASMLIAGPAAAASCGSEDFSRWLAEFGREAASNGISQRALSALDGVAFDQNVINRERAQSVFSQSFLEFSGRMVADYRLQHGAARLKKHAATFARIEKEFGVPGPVIVAFWGLETDFGANMGDLPTLRSLATLACAGRRAEEFREHLHDALRIVDRGDLSPREMKGPWAGELGQTQFLASVYKRYAVDYDGDGRRDLLKSVPDVLASTANYLVGLGWRRGEPWLEEVRLPADLPWDQADIGIRHPRSSWARWGVTLSSGRPLPTDDVRASLLLPMGRRGPAFLAYPNFAVYLEWNNSLVYATTAAYFATRLAGAPRVSRGSGATALTYGQIKELQAILARRGYSVGKVDGILGAATRASVKDVQMKLGLPADSYPTPELLDRLRTTR